MPTFTGELGMIPVSTYESPYSVPPVLQDSQVNLVQIQENSRVIAAECKLIFKDTHTCLRGLEVSTFMLNDKDHMHSEKIPNSAPMAYIMKGKSLPTDDLYFIVNDCCKELHKCQIPILCEIYDG